MGLKADIEAAFREIGKASGPIAISLARGKVTRRDLAGWATSLRRAADMLERADADVPTGPEVS